METETEPLDGTQERRNGLEIRDVDLDDMCFARLKAVVEADSSIDALEKYLKEHPFKLYRGNSDNDQDLPGCGFTEENDIYPSKTFRASDYEITRVYIRASYGALRNFDSTYAEIQLTPYRVSHKNLTEVLVWVYQMGGHWVICC